MKVLKKVFKVWNLKLEQAKGPSPSGHQAHQLPEQSASYPSTAAQTVGQASMDQASMDQASSDDSICYVYDFG